MDNLHDRNPAEETSMEDILSSIRQILASDEDPSEKAPASKAKSLAPKEDIIELTEEVVTPHTPAPIHDTKAATTNTATKHEESPAMITPSQQDAKLISQKTVEAASQALSKLNEALQPVQSAPVAHTNVGDSVTLEALVTQAMQPILKEWMDKNLPQVIEQVVATEIKKLVRQST